MSTAVCVNDTGQFIFFLVMKLKITIVTRIFSSLKLEDGLKQRVRNVTEINYGFANSFFFNFCNMWLGNSFSNFGNINYFHKKSCVTKNHYSIFYAYITHPLAFFLKAFVIFSLVNHCWATFIFYTHQFYFSSTFRFLVFSGGIKWKH